MVLGLAPVGSTIKCKNRMLGLKVPWVRHFFSKVCPNFWAKHKILCSCVDAVAFCIFSMNARFLMRCLQGELLD